MMIKQGKEGRKERAKEIPGGGEEEPQKCLLGGGEGGEIRATKIPPWNTVAYQGPVSRRSR